MKNFYCKNCGVKLQSDKEPVRNGCKNGDIYGHHSWYDLGEVGNKNHYCKNCGVILQSDKEPFNNGCPNGDIHGHHSWWYLGEVGNKNFQCKNCGITLQSDKEPVRNGCKNGDIYGHHSWNYLGETGNNNYQSTNINSEIGKKNYRRPDYESTMNTKGKTKPSIGGIIVPIIAFLFIVFELIGDFFNSVGTAGYIILPIVIGFTIFRIWRELKFIFHIFNCVWILFMISFCFSEIKNDMANTKLVIFSIIFFLLLILLPTFIRFIFNKIRKKIMEK